MSYSRARAPMTTIISDASYSDRTRRGAWAGRAIYEGRRIQHAALSKGECASSNDAEFAALVNTLYLARANACLPDGAGWVLQSDNMHVVGLVEKHLMSKGKGRKISPYQKVALDYLMKIYRECQPEFVWVKHVKGHLKHEERDKRHHVQEAMDKLATEAMRTALHSAVERRWIEIACPTCKADDGESCKAKITSRGDSSTCAPPPPDRAPHFGRIEAAFAAGLTVEKSDA